MTDREPLVPNEGLAPASEATTPTDPEAGAPTVAANSTVDLMLNRDA